MAMKGRLCALTLKKKPRYPLCKGALRALQDLGLVIEYKSFYSILKGNPNILAIIA
jgi:hypothetical protein